MKTTEVKRGGLSDEVFYSKPMREYLAEREQTSGAVAFGYIGDNLRHRTKDREVEEALCGIGLDDDEIAEILTSNIGRQLADVLAKFGSKDKIDIRYAATEFARRYRGDIARMLGREAVAADEASKRVTSIKANAARLIAEAQKLERQIGANELAADMLKRIDVALDAVVVATF